MHMLTRLAIADFAVVRQAELVFGPGMTVVSGETGAGKSLLVDALAFLSGQRADAGVVRHGADRAELSAEFDLIDAPAALQWLRDAEMDEDGQCQLRRVLRADGGSKSWINGRSVTLAQLSELAALLVEIHGQHAHQALLSKPAQLALLDAYGRHAAPLAAVGEAHTRWQALRFEWEALNARGDVGDRIEFLRHQLGELDAETLEADAIEMLNHDHRRQAHAAELIEATQSATAQLQEGEDGAGIATLLHRTRETLSRVIAHEPRLGDVDTLLEQAAIAADEAGDTLARIADDLEIEPERFAQLDAQIQRLHALARKHRVGVEALADTRARLHEELATLLGSEERVAALREEISAAETAWRTAASALTKARKTSAKRLSEATVAIIRSLGMGEAAFDVQLEPLEDPAPNPQGAERTEFLIAANPGQPARPLRKVASGGELSRISLAIEVAALGIDTVPTMVFDEVDTGISGAVAEVVGRKLRALGSERQVMCVTHLPQVAAAGHAHYRVSKAAAEGVTRSAVEVLDAAGRVEEIARLLGGVKLTDAAREAARSLLAEASS